MAHDPYKLDPLDFNVEEVTIQHISLESSSEVTYLDINMVYYSTMMQKYPEVALKDIEDGKNEVLNFFDIESFEEAESSKVYAITNNVNNIFALYNEKNNKFFCLPAKYFPELYDPSLTIMLKNSPELYVKHLNKSEILLYTFIYSLKTTEAINFKLHNIASKYILYQKLDSSIEHKNEINSKKLKI